MLDLSRARGAVYGGAIGDALGMPVEGLSHQNVRTYYRGIKDLTADAKRCDLQAGQWTLRTELALELGQALTSAPVQGPARLTGGSRPLRRLSGSNLPPAGAAPASVAPVAVAAADAAWSAEELLGRLHDLLGALYPGAESLVAAFGQAQAIMSLLAYEADALDGSEFVAEVHDAAAWAESRLAASSACSDRLRTLGGQLDSFPLDLQDCCNGTGFAPDEGWPFAVAMVARRPALVEATVLSAVNVGGDAPTVGACTGALLGALHGSDGFPPSWLARVEGRPLLERLVARLPPGQPEA